MYSLLFVLFVLLVLPLSTPLSLTRDHGVRRSNCIDESTRKPSWNISDWSLDFTDPEQGGSLIFQLHNNAINYTTLCFRRGFLSQCFWTSGGTGDSAIDDLTETYFAFDEVTNKLDVNQTWACPGEPTETPVTFNALGSTTVLPSCGEETKPREEEDPESVICGSVGGTVQGKLTYFI